MGMMGWLRTLATRDEDQGALGRHGMLLASLILLLVALPVTQLIAGSSPRFQVLLTLVLVAAIIVNSRQRWIFIVAATVGAGAVAGIAFGQTLNSVPILIASDTLSLGLLGFTTLVMLNSLVQADEVSGDTIVGGICVYLLVGLCFAMVFLIMTEVYPGAFVAGGEAIARSAEDPSAHATRLLYFSFVTLTTLGYGDIAPVGDLAQMFAVAEALIGQLYLTIFVARLVALFAFQAGPDVEDGRG